MPLLVSTLACAYVVGTAWAASLLFRGLMHERHMFVHHDLGGPVLWWEYPLTAVIACLWPVPMMACLVVDFFSMDDA